MTATLRPELRVTVFSDYICPFCYIGYLRLERLRAVYDLKVHWRLLEIHPETPREGRPVAELGYGPAQWDAMMRELARMAGSENVRLAAHERTSNSHLALLLAEAAKEAGPTAFYSLHRRLFQAYLEEGHDIADAALLRDLAREAGLAPELPERAWNEPVYEERLRANLAAAVQAGVTGTPSFFFGTRRLVGAVPVDRLLDAAHGAAIEAEPPSGIR